MAYSYVVYTGNGATTQYSVPFPYIRKEHVYVSINYINSTAFTWVNASTIQMNSAPANGARVEVRRTTPVSAPLVDFADGSTLVAADLDTVNLQQTYVNQEQDDQFADAVFINSQGNLDAGGKRITNVGNPTAAQDAVTKTYADTWFNTYGESYLGSSATDPATKPNGGALTVGVWYFNTTANRIRIYNGQIWTDGASPSGLVRWKKTAAGGETSLSGADDNSFTLAYTPALEQLYINGALQTRAVDYLATNGTSVTGLAALTAGDVVEVLSFNNWVVATVPDASVTNAKVAAGAGIAASKLGFVQAGTGAVQRTVEAKLQDVVSVKDFGAVGDGVTNDTTAWGNWLAAAGSKYIPAGSYLVSGVVKRYRTPVFVNTSDTNHSTGLYSLENIASGNANTAVGNLAGSALTTGSQNTAVGKSALETLAAGNNNTAVGFGALRYASDPIAIQNTCIGAYAGTAITFGANNTAVGHNTLLTLTTGNLNSAFGQGALAYNVTGSYNCAFGYHCLLNYTGSNGTAYGVEALTSLTTGINNTAFGYRALKAVVTAGSNTAFGYLAGQVITSSQNTCMGDSALYATTTGAANTAYGYNTLVANQTGANNTAVGSQSLISNVSGSRNAALGRFTLVSATGDDNTAIGTSSLYSCTTGYANTALGAQALQNLATFNNCTGIGFDAQVTGSNQVQIGDSSTTTYVYGAVQNRSDMRDKSDVRDTILGLDFVNRLRPVDFRWDYREDYDGEKDGSKVRTRFHHGLIAQEVKAACDAAGVDFGGYQDHRINGGEDVMSIGYAELIAPLIKAVQQLSAEVEQLKANFYSNQ